MAALLLSGPAGASKSLLARRMIEDGQANIVLDFQAIAAALLGLRRDPETGRYPERDAAFERIMPMTEYLRQTAITYARDHDLGVVMTNSDGDLERRASLLARLGPEAAERVIDPGREVVSARLADPVSGQLSAQCAEAIARWYR